MPNASHGRLGAWDDRRRRALHCTRARRGAASCLLATTFATPSHAILGGTLDPVGSPYGYMGRLSNGYGATPIAASWIVTAAHVAPAIGETFTNPEGTFRIAEVVKDPSGADVALVRVGGTLIHTYAYGAAPIGGVASLVGYGASGPIGRNPAANGAGDRYVARNTLDAHVSIRLSGSAFPAYAFDLDDGTAAHSVLGSPNPVDGEGGIGAGDSGGGWFVDRGAGPLLVAVSSGVLAQASLTGEGSSRYYDYGGVGFGASLSGASGFIRATTQVSPVPEPASLALAALVLPIARRRYFRR